MARPRGGLAREKDGVRAERTGECVVHADIAQAPDENTDGWAYGAQELPCSGAADRHGSTLDSDLVVRLTAQRTRLSRARR
jgi:hypothetical protein